MKKLIALAALIIYAQPVQAMEALKAKQQTITAQQREKKASIKKEKEKLQEQIERLKKKIEQGESSQSAPQRKLDDKVIARALRLVQALPEKLAAYKLKSDIAAERAALAELDKIQDAYFELYTRNKNNESIQEITDLLAEGVPAPITPEMWQALETMETLKLNDALERVNTYIKVGENALANAKKESQQAAINKQLELLKKEKQILEALIKNPDEMAIFAHQKELLKELDALTAALKQAKNEEREAKIKKEIDQLYKRAPHLLPAAEMGRAAQTKKFLPKNIKAYILAKRDAILEASKN